jgi:Tfp pilus assembly protein PilP
MRSDETRNAVQNAAASATDDLWCRANEARRKAEAEQLSPFDPDCRYGAVDPSHRCTDPFGAPVREGGTCFSEANAQMHDQRRRERFEALAQDAAEIERIRLQREFVKVADLDKALVERLYPPCLEEASQP